MTQTEAIEKPFPFTPDFIWTTFVCNHCGRKTGRGEITYRRRT